MSIINRKKQNREYAKSVQISVTFPSPDRRAAVQQLLADKAELEGLNKGAIASSILVDKLIPLTGEEREIFLACLPNGKEAVYPDNSGIDNALELAFSYASMSTPSRYSADVTEYVKLATKRAWKYELLIHGRISDDDPRVNLARDLRLIAGDDPSAKGLFKLLSEDRPEAYPFFNYVFENWERLNGNRNALSFLVYLCAACENRTDSAEDRQELLEACSIAQATRMSKKESIQFAAKEAKAASMARIPIANDGTLVIPGSWTLINAANAKGCSYAGVIEVRNSPDAPHVVFLSPKPINDLTKEEQESVFEQAALYVPFLTTIRNAEVELEYNDDGGVANRDEYNNSPRIGFFPIMDSTMFNDSNPAPYGAMIIRAGTEVPLKSE